MSQFYATEVPDEKDSDSDTEAIPRKSFKERYAMASKEKKDGSANLPGQVVVPDVQSAQGGVATEDGGARGDGKQDVKEVVSEAPPTQNEGEEEGADLPSEDLVDRILETMWGYCHAYHISNAVSYMYTYNVTIKILYISISCLKLFSSFFI